MATFTLTIPDTEVYRVTSALCASGGYTDTTVANATAALIDYFGRTVVNVETAAALAAALAAAAPIVAPVGLS